MSGSSMLAIDRNGINYNNLVKMNMNVTDLIESIRVGGYPDITNIKYAVFETNGQICIIKNTESTDNDFLPIALIIDGKLDKKSLHYVGCTELQIKMVLQKNGINSFKRVALADVRQNGSLFVSPKQGKSFVDTLSVTKEW